MIIPTLWKDKWVTIMQPFIIFYIFLILLLALSSKNDFRYVPKDKKVKEYKPVN